MFRTAIIGIVALCPLLLLTGCPSEAAFPGVCGNGVREPGEACDGNEIDPAHDTCAENGAGTGTVSCAPNCVLNLDLCTGAFDCDPLTNDRCDGGKVCYYDPNSTRTDCSNAGDLVVGASCGHSAECQAQMVCVLEKCHLMCTSGDQCDNGTACFAGAWPMDWGYCPIATLECDPVARTGCTGLSSCYILNTSGELGCIPTSTGELGDPCSAAAYCKPGLQCTSTTNGTCVQLCWLTEDCGSGECITQENWTTGLGVCF